MSDKPKPFDDAYLIRDGWKRVKIYPYTTADGIELYQKLRYERPNPNEPKGYEKTFLIRRPDGNGGWYGEMGDERVLYRQQNIIDAPLDERVHIGEGEKAADRAAKANLLATCIAAGWGDVDIEPLRGRDCCVIRDDDQGGKDKNADHKSIATAEAICKIAKTVRIGRLPGLPPAGGLDDWLDLNNNDVAKLNELCEAAALYEPQPKADEVSLVWECMADIEPEPVDWIWLGRLARGKITLIAGDPGMGKSQIGLDLAARISTGDRFPDGGIAPTGSILILTAEDSAKDTVRPRLEAAGADLTSIHRLKAAVFKDGGVTTFSLQQDLTALSRKIKELGSVMLVIIDPITSYMGGKIDSHRVTDVRAVLEPLAAWAEHHHVAVIGITHPTKAAPAKALHSIVGSIAYVAAARLVFLAIEEAETERRLLLAVKNNLGRLSDGLGYSLAQTVISKGIIASYVLWDTLPVTVTANEALARTKEDGQALTDAKDFLRDELSAGPRLQTDLQKAAEAAGHSWSTVRRAQKRLKIKPYKTGLQGGWEWKLPEDAHEDGHEDAQ